MTKIKTIKAHKEYISSSEYTRRVRKLVEEWETDYPIEEDFEQSIIDELEEIRDLTRESLDNMPKNLRDGEIGLLRERIDALEEAINEIGNFECWDTYEEEIIDYMVEENDSKDGDASDSSPDEKEVKEHVKEKYRALIKEALRGLKY